MNEFKNLSYQVTEPEYRAYPAYSYSLLSRFKQLGYANIDKLFDKISTPSLTFGKLVDCLVTEGEKVFRNTYTPMCIKVSDTIKEIVDDIYKNVLDASINIDILENLDTNAINEIAVRHSYYDNPRYDKSRADKVIKEGSEYFKYHIRFTGLNADDLEVGKYEVTYSEIHLDTREPFASKRIVRINPISCTKIE